MKTNEWVYLRKKKCENTCIGFKIKEFIHRLENRCVLRHISNINFQSWAVLVSQAEKKIQTAISVLLLRPGLYVFMGKNHFKYPYVRTEKIHNMNAIFAFQINQESKIG